MCKNKNKLIQKYNSLRGPIYFKILLFSRNKNVYIYIYIYNAGFGSPVGLSNALIASL